MKPTMHKRRPSRKLLSARDSRLKSQVFTGKQQSPRWSLSSTLAVVQVLTLLMAVIASVAALLALNSLQRDQPVTSTLASNRGALYCGKDPNQTVTTFTVFILSNQGRLGTTVLDVGLIDDQIGFVSLPFYSIDVTAQLTGKPFNGPVKPFFIEPGRVYSVVVSDESRWGNTVDYHIDTPAIQVAFKLSSDEGNSNHLVKHGDPELARPISMGDAGICPRP